jgi:uncharacterized membrane protein YjfL (UPF0719 family)
MLQSQDFEHFAEVEEETLTKSASTPIWRILGGFMLGTVSLLLIAALICLKYGIAPTLYNMLNQTDTAPFAVAAVNFIQGAHMIMALALYYRTKPKTLWLARIQLGLAVATHVAFVLVLFLLPFLGWSQDWASVLPVYTWGVWELVVLLALYQRLPFFCDFLAAKKYKKTGTASIITGYTENAGIFY